MAIPFGSLQEINNFVHSYLKCYKWMNRKLDVLSNNTDDWILSYVHVTLGCLA